MTWFKKCPGNPRRGLQDDPESVILSTLEYADKEMSPTLEYLVVLTWLRLVHPDLPSLVKQRYGTELRSKSLASLKPEISQALDSLLEEINNNADAKILRSKALKLR